MPRLPSHLSSGQSSAVSGLSSGLSSGSSGFPWGAGLALALLLATGCSVPDKQRPGNDGSVPGDDSGTPPDTGPLETTLDEAPDMFSRFAQATFRFSSPRSSAMFECRIDDEAAAPCQSPYTVTLLDGSHSFSVRALDGTGQSDGTPAERVWTIDTVAPSTTLRSVPPKADNSLNPMFKFASNEDNVTFECSLDGAGYQPCTSGSSFTLSGDGPHSFAVRAIDRAGNTDLSGAATYPWGVDTSTPDTQIQSVVPDASSMTTAEFAFLSPDAGANSTFQCALDGAGFAACTSPRLYTGLTEGSHTFSVRVRDANGNFDPSPATRTWTVDLTPPNTTIVSGPAGMLPVASASVTFSSNELNTTFKCGLDGAELAPCTSPASLTGLAQGPHTFAVRATDAAGHVDASPATATWTVDTIAPVVAITAGPAAAGTSGPRVSFAFTASDGAITCSLDGGAFAPCASPVAINLPAGPHAFAVRATDGATNATTVNRSWTVVCGAPDAAVAAGLLHLDDGGQSLANAVAGGAPATLGDTIALEPGDPTPLTLARFGGGLSFAAANGDHVAWPIALAAMPDVTLEVWARPAAPAGARDLVVSGDGRVALRVTAASATTVRFSIEIAEGGMMGMTRIASSAAVAAGAWHHVLASLQAPTLRLWVDGVRTEIAGVTLATPLALDALRLGGGGATAYDGALDEVWVAQTAITSDEPALARYCPL